ncbi:MAG: TIGR02117 family protein [Bernardetiaceae bacterium]|nr:TIGR02117 family protein [Bernardetiaceae bacterium]
MLKIIKKILFFISLPIFAYLLIAFIGSAIPTGSKALPPPVTCTPVYIMSNGFHTEFILPMGAVWDSLEAKVSDKAWLNRHQNASHVSFGWGDEGFFLHSYDSTNIGLGVLAKAGLLPSPTLMHLTFVHNDPEKHYINTHFLSVSDEQLQILKSHIWASFAEEQGKIQRIKARGYGSKDYFFEAKGRYHAFNTCNNWTNKGLKAAGIRNALWTPFAQGVMWHLP